MLQVSHLSKTYGIQTILDDVSFVLSRGERVGLVGVNGAGKTTLLRILAGMEQPDAGLVRLDAHASLGYLPQGLALDEAVTLDALIRQGVAAWETARREMDALSAQLERDAINTALLAQYGDAVERFDVRGGYAVEARIVQVQQGLGLAQVPRDLVVGKLSGGQRTRAGLARLLIAAPDVLLLDEPTNHLDVDALEWLENFVRAYSGAVLIVSHDRVFLDHTVSQIFELDDMTHRVTIYHGAYTAYEQAKAHALAQQWSAYADQQTELARLADASQHLRSLARFRKGGKADTNDKFAKGFFANRGKETVRRAKAVERRIEILQTDEKIEKPKAGYAMKLDFGDERFGFAMPRSGQMVLRLENVGMRFGETWLFRHATGILRHGERIALLGANGTGKSTLLKIIVGQLMPGEGAVHLGANVRLGYMPQEQETLDVSQTPLTLVRALLPVDETAARHFLHQFMFQGDEVFSPIGRLSYGERARLILAKLVAEKSNVLLLDEPVNHLDIPSRERFQTALEAFPGTILLVAHDRAFIERFASGFWVVENQTLRAYFDRAPMQVSAKKRT